MFVSTLINNIYTHEFNIACICTHAAERLLFREIYTLQIHLLHVRYMHAVKPPNNGHEVLSATRRCSLFSGEMYVQ